MEALSLYINVQRITDGLVLLERKRESLSAQEWCTLLNKRCPNPIMMNISRLKIAVLPSQTVTILHWLACCIEFDRSEFV